MGYFFCRFMFYNLNYVHFSYNTNKMWASSRELNTYASYCVQRVGLNVSFSPSHSLSLFLNLSLSLFLCILSYLDIF